MFQNPFLTRIPYSSQLQKKKKKISELILPSDLILLSYMGLLKGNKSDPIIFRILNSHLLLLLLFSSQFRVYLYYLGLIVSGHHISPHKGSIRASLYFSFANQYSLGGGLRFQYCWCLGTSYLCVTLLSNLIYFAFRELVSLRVGCVTM